MVENVLTLTRHRNLVQCQPGRSLSQENLPTLSSNIGILRISFVGNSSVSLSDSLVPQQRYLSAEVVISVPGKFRSWRTQESGETRRDPAAVLRLPGLRPQSGREQVQVLSVQRSHRTSNTWCSSGLAPGTWSLSTPTPSVTRSVSSWLELDCRSSLSISAQTSSRRERKSNNTSV